MTLELKHFDPRLNQWIYTDERDVYQILSLEYTVFLAYHQKKHGYKAANGYI
jgi:hypothetical protein